METRTATALQDVYFVCNVYVNYATPLLLWFVISIELSLCGLKQLVCKLCYRKTSAVFTLVSIFE